jgi:hypothetical protein
VNHLQRIKTQVARSMRANYQGSTHKAVDTSQLVWRIANKARELRLQEVVPNRDGLSSAKPVPDLRTEGREKFAAGSLATFNKKVQDMASGRVVPPESDDLPTPDFGDDGDREEEEDMGDEIEFND